MDDDWGYPHFRKPQCKEAPSPLHGLETGREHFVHDAPHAHAIAGRDLGVQQLVVGHLGLVGSGFFWGFGWIRRNDG